MDSEQTQSDWSVHAAAWWEVNKKAVFKVVIAILVICFAWYSWSFYHREKELEASGALIKLIRPPDPSGKPVIPTASEYQAVVEHFAGTTAAERAELLAAGGLFAEKKYPEAKHAFEKFLAANPDGALSEIAEFGAAACVNESNDVDKAIAAYQQFVSRHSSSPMANQARLELGMLLESKNQADQALKLYDQVVRDKDMSIWAMTAEERQKEIYTRFPNLAPKLPDLSGSTNSALSIVSNIVSAAAAKSATTTNSPSTKK